MIHKELKEYAEMAASYRRLADENDYWKFGDSRINDKAPQYKGNCLIVHGQSFSGKTTLLHKMARELPRNIKIIVVVFDTRDVEAQNFWKDASDQVINLSKECRFSIGIREMVLRFQSIFEKCLADVFDDGSDVLLIIDSCSQLVHAITESGIVPRGITLSGGIDQNVSDYIGSLFDLAGNYCNGGSFTIWGTCFVQNDEEIMSEGASFALSQASTSDIVMDRAYRITNKSISKTHIQK